MSASTPLEGHSLAPPTHFRPQVKTLSQATCRTTNSTKPQLQTVLLTVRSSEESICCIATDLADIVDSTALLACTDNDSQPVGSNPLHPHRTVPHLHHQVPVKRIRRMSEVSPTIHTVDTASQCGHLLACAVDAVERAKWLQCWMPCCAHSVDILLEYTTWSTHNLWRTNAAPLWAWPTCW